MGDSHKSVHKIIYHIDNIAVYDIIFRDRTLRVAIRCGCYVCAAKIRVPKSSCCSHIVASSGTEDFREDEMSLADQPLQKTAKTARPAVQLPRLRTLQKSLSISRVPGGAGHSQ
jgi:hypothetical protein